MNLISEKKKVLEKTGNTNSITDNKSNNDPPKGSAIWSKEIYMALELLTTEGS